MRKRKAGIICVLLLLLTGAGAGAFLHFYTGTGSVSMRLEENREEISNPSRGFYIQVDTAEGGLPDEVWEENLRLILLTFDLKEEKEETISSGKMEELTHMLDLAHEAAVKVIFRAAYGFDSEDAYHDPQDIGTVLSHIRQTAPVLNAHKSDILCVQAGFLGPWGEWHHSNLLGGEDDKENRNRVLAAWTEILEAPLTVNVRRPRFVRDAQDAGIPVERLGIHNDALLSGDDDMGTYDTYGRKDELDWIDNSLSLGVNGGEMPAVSDYTKPENVLKEFGQLHLTYLNRGYNKEVLQQWKNAALTQKEGEENAYDVISRKLGYRFFLESVELNDGLRDFHSLKLRVRLGNSGFAPIAPGYRLYAVLDTGKSIRYVPVEPEAGLSGIKGGQSASGEVEIPLSDLYRGKENRPDVLRAGLLITDREVPETDSPAAPASPALASPAPASPAAVHRDTVCRDTVCLANNAVLWENGINYIGQYEWKGADSQPEGAGKFPLLSGKYVWSRTEAEAPGEGGDGIGSAQEAKGTDSGINTEEDLMHMVVFKVGKADAILLSSEGKNILIDTGEEEDGEEILDYLRENGMDTIDALILTHFDKDHVGGADRIIENAEVSQVYEPDYDSDSTQYEEYDTSVNKTGTPVEALDKPVSFTCGGMEVSVYPPLKKDYEEENDYSLITSVVYGKNRLLFAGDAETERLKELVEGEQELAGGLAHTFLKLPHHGRREKELEAFLDAVTPSLSVITCSDKNPPDGEVLDLLARRDITVFLTSDGNVYGESDGKTLRVWQ